jgi:hypothetical protein
MAHHIVETVGWGRDGAIRANLEAGLCKSPEDRGEVIGGLHLR